MAFKDLALSVVGQLYGYFLEKRKRHITVLVGTSGDTGSAAIEAVRGMKWVDIIVLLPQGRCTKIQELQMTTVVEDNVHNFAVDGTSDDLDIPIKRVFADWPYVSKHNLCSINSINWARILVQITHFVYCYFRACDTLEAAVIGSQEVEVVVPTGACGNVAAGYVAREMGFPLKFVTAVNCNDIVHRMVHNGDFSVSREVLPTWAPAMDIQIPYNVERILLMACQLNTSRVAELMTKFEAHHRAAIPEDILQIINQVIVDSVRVKDNDILETLERCAKENDGYLLCPHTAVGIKYHYDNPPKSPRICIATASPAKFPEAIQKAHLYPHKPEAILQLFVMKTKYDVMEKGQDWEAMLRKKIEEITEKCTRFG